MYILSKYNEISSLEIQKITKCLYKKKEISNKDIFIIKNPLHLEYLKNLNFSSYDSIYEIDENYNINKNKNLSKILNTKNELEIKRILINNCRDKVFAKSFMEKLLNSNSYSPNSIYTLKIKIKRLINSLYYEKKDSSLAIKSIRKELSAIKHKTLIQESLLFILNNRATRYTLLNILKELSELEQYINLTKLNSNSSILLNSLISDTYNKIILSNIHYNTISNDYDKPNMRYIPPINYQNILIFDNEDEIIKNCNKCNPNIKYIYLERNNMIIKRISYLDLLKMDKGKDILEKLFTSFNQSNLDIELIDKELILYIIENNMNSILNLLMNKFKLDILKIYDSPITRNYISYNFKFNEHSTILNLIYKNHN